MSSAKKASSKSSSKQRVRVTNKGVEAQRFSTVPLSQLRREADPSKVLPSASPAASSSQQLKNVLAEGGHADGGFDPIVSDATFSIVASSSYWPPPTLEALQKSSGVEVKGDGFDDYDRRDEEAAARKEKASEMKKKGELQHPRGKQRKNVVEKLDDSGSDSE